jgi:hypothetical protein
MDLRDLPTALPGTPSQHQQTWLFTQLDPRAT